MQVRRWAQSWIKPGIKLIDMCEAIEEKNRQLVQESGLKVRRRGEEGRERMCDEN